MLIWNVPVPLKIESDLLIKSKGEERFLPLLITAAKNLEKGGADFLVMPCNSLHLFIKETRKAVRVPVLNIIEETVKFLKEQKVNKIGILATSITLNKKLFNSHLEAAGIKQVIPSKTQQKIIDQIIKGLVWNNPGVDSKKKIMQVISKLKKAGINNILLACTDLQLLNLRHPRIRIFDTMKILTEATANELLGIRPNSNKTDFANETVLN